MRASAQTIILLPVQTAVCQYRLEGALLVLVAVHLSVAGSYSPPVLKAVAGHAKPTTPDDHFTTGPDGGMPVSR